MHSNLFVWIVCCSSNERFGIFLLLRCSGNGIGEKHIAEVLIIFSPKYLTLDTLGTRQNCANSWSSAANIWPLVGLSVTEK